MSVNVTEQVIRDHFTLCHEIRLTDVTDHQRNGLNVCMSGCSPLRVSVLVLIVVMIKLTALVKQQIKAYWTSSYKQNE